MTMVDRQRSPRYTSLVVLRTECVNAVLFLLTMSFWLPLHALKVIPFHDGDKIHRHTMTEISLFEFPESQYSPLIPAGTRSLLRSHEYRGRS